MSEKPTAEGLPKRWSARRKSEVVLRLLRGEDIGELSREIRVPAPELARWRRKFLEGACEGLKTKNAPDGELMRTRAKLGEMTMRVELQAELLEKRGYGEELRKLLRRAVRAGRDRDAGRGHGSADGHPAEPADRTGARLLA